MIKKILAITMTTVILFSGCGKDTEKKEKETTKSAGDVPVTIMIDNKEYQLKTGDELRVEGFEPKKFTLEINDKEKKAKKVSVNGISYGDSLKSVEKLMESGKAYLDYEYDPYHDGCTAIETEIYDGEMIDFDELDVLDCFISMQYYYDEKTETWIMCDYNNLPDLDGALILRVAYDIQGPAGNDYDTDETVRAMICSLYKTEE